MHYRMCSSTTTGTMVGVGHPRAFSPGRSAHLKGTVSPGRSAHLKETVSPGKSAHLKGTVTRDWLPRFFYHQSTLLKLVQGY